MLRKDFYVSGPPDNQTLSMDVTAAPSQTALRTRSHPARDAQDIETSRNCPSAPAPSSSSSPASPGAWGRRAPRGPPRAPGSSQTPPLPPLPPLQQIPDCSPSTPHNCTPPFTSPQSSALRRPARAPCSCARCAARTTPNTVVCAGPREATAPHMRCIADSAMARTHHPTSRINGANMIPSSPAEPNSTPMHRSALHWLMRPRTHSFALTTRTARTARATRLAS